MGPTCEHVMEPKVRRSVANRIKFTGVLCLRQYGLTFAKPNDCMEVARQCRMDDCTVFERFPYDNALGRVGTSVCTDRLQFEMCHH